MIDASVLDYEFEEETLGFEEPSTQAEVPMKAGKMASIAVVSLGLLALVFVLSGGPLSGTWLGLVLSFGLIVLGSAGVSWFEYKDTEPGIKNDGIAFSSTTGRGHYSLGARYRHNGLLRGPLLVAGKSGARRPPDGSPFPVHSRALERTAGSFTDFFTPSPSWYSAPGCL